MGAKIPRMDYRQYRAACRLVHECCNYDIEMCSPVCITGENFRKAKAREKMEQLKKLLNRKESL